MTDPANRMSQIGYNHDRAEPIKIRQSRKFVEDNSSDKISLTDLATAVNMSPTHLSEKFKEVTGMNFVRYVAQVRFQNACELLHDLDLRISEIAFAVGFQSLSQFNRVFKRLSGKSPTEFRTALKTKKSPQKIGRRNA